MILIVDDHEDTCDLVRRVLARDGLAAECLTDSRQAIAAMRAMRPGVVILDQTMPGLTGTEILAAIPVVMYSAVFEHGVAQVALGLGASEWLVKGVHGPRHLVAAVKRAMVV